jgi:hypothetical protein
MVDVSLPMEYLERSKVFGIFNKRGELVGGFLIVMTGQLRSLRSLPSKELIPDLVDTWDIGEVNGLWLSPEVRKKSVSILFWLLVAREVIFSGKKHFIYTYTTKKKKLGDIYASVKPITLYEGETPVLEGMDESDVETIQLVSVKNIIVALFTTPKFFVRRVFGKRRVIHRTRAYAG